MKFWCATAFMDTLEVLGVAPLLDEAGYHGVMVSDHLVHPRDLQSRYPYSPHPDGRPIWEPETSWPDPWVLIGAMAALTERLRFTTNIYVAPHRALLQLAKEVATAAVVSGNRVALGAGAGWMREEFDLQGQDYESRGRRLNEMIPALRALWKGGWVEHHGEHYDIPPVMMEPHPSEAVPIYGGGHTGAALRRAARLCDGWIGNAYGWDEAAHHVARLKQFLDEFGRSDDDFEIICGLYALPEPDLFHRAEEELGITGTLCVPWVLDADVATPSPVGVPRSPEVYRPSIERFADEVLAHCQP